MSEDLALERPGESLLLKTWVPQGARRHTFSAGPVDRSVTRSGVDTVEELFGSFGGLGRRQRSLVDNGESAVGKSLAAVCAGRVIVVA